MRDFIDFLQEMSPSTAFIVLLILFSPLILISLYLLIKHIVEKKRDPENGGLKKWQLGVMVAFTVIVIGGFGVVAAGSSSNSGSHSSSRSSSSRKSSSDKSASSDSKKSSESTSDVRFGKLLEVNTSGTTAVVKVKIEPSYSNSATINQNYFNVCDLIRNKGYGKYDEVQYWAVADMQDGSESKVISFTIKKDLIDKITTNKVNDDEISDKVDDLYILPSLMN